MTVTCIIQISNVVSYILYYITHLYFDFQSCLRPLPPRRPPGLAPVPPGCPTVSTVTSLWPPGPRGLKLSSDAFRWGRTLYL